MHGLSFWDQLEERGRAIAFVLADGRTVDYAGLAELSDAFARRLPSRRQLVAIAALNEPEAVAAYLGCLRHRHPVLLIPDEALTDGRIVETYRPDWLYRKGENGWTLERLGEMPAEEFNPELAVLLSTSGTTGNPKLVRLSHENISSNAIAIGSYLGLDATDAAITSLSFYYSYGMAVLNSHLAAGARILLTDEPITSHGFWELFSAQGATHLALVPYHFELLDRARFSEKTLPTLRHITQAGGKLHADKLRAYAELSRAKGWQFFVMYGQTEASPRMAFVPPSDILENVQAIGRPIPGGTFSLLDDAGRDIATPGVAGELVYRGPNVMLGYADNRADLSKPREVEALHTGDMAEIQPNGYFRIVGRLKRFIKLYGLRINLDDVERHLSQKGQAIYCTGTDEKISVFSEADVDADEVRSSLLAAYNIQPAQIAVTKLQSLPLLPSGKVNYQALSAIKVSDENDVETRDSLLQDYADILRRPDIGPNDTFQTIGGDSLAYLSISFVLEKRLGYAPPNWEGMTIAELERLEPSGSSFVSVPFTSPLRLASVFTVVFVHVAWISLVGGAFLLLMLSGHFFAKTQFAEIAAGRSLLAARQTLLRILIAYFIVLTVYFSLDGFAHDPTDFMAAWYFLVANTHWWDHEPVLYPYWFVSAYVQIVLLMCLTWKIPSVRSVFRLQPLYFGYLFTLFSFAGAMIERAIYGIDVPYQTQTVTLLHLFALGWCIAFSKTKAEKIITSAVLTIVSGFVWYGVEVYPVTIYVFVILGGLATIWIDSVLLPKRVATVVSFLSACSLYIYLSHIVPVYILRYVFDVSPYLTRVGEGIFGFVISAFLGAGIYLIVQGLMNYRARNVDKVSEKTA